jgi:hypothetical protein
MKEKKCPECGWKITDPKEWSFVFKECMVCNDLRMEETFAEMKKNGEEDGPPDPFKMIKRKVPENIGIFMKKKKEVA